MKESISVCGCGGGGGYDDTGFRAWEGLCKEKEEVPLSCHPKDALLGEQGAGYGDGSLSSSEEPAASEENQI